MANKVREQDLPMSANTSDISVGHFVLELTCHLHQKNFDGSVTLFLQPLPNQHSMNKQLQPNVKKKEHCDEERFGTSKFGEQISLIPTKNEESCVMSDLLKPLLPGGIFRQMNETKSVQWKSDDSDATSCEKLVTHTDPQISEYSKRQFFQLVLDCYKLDIQRVVSYSLYCDSADVFSSCQRVQEKMLRDHLKIVEDGIIFQLPPEWSVSIVDMNFVVEEHCLRISVDDCHEADSFPVVVQIMYSTRADGPSLSWTVDQDGQPCVFTIGHLLSNRSLFPNQDTPSALSTWQASVTVDDNLTVLMTGDSLPTILPKDSGRKQFCYSASYPMPSSTFALAIGSWKTEEVIPVPVQGLEDLHLPPTRLFFPECLREITSALLQWYLPRCFVHIQHLLGTYPFQRLDVLIVPACFDSLGMASPSLLFISQSLLCSDYSMCVRVAHELCHTWFGLLIGPLDWTEEWLTEGFCTYMEDILHAQVCEMGKEASSYLDLRADLHLLLLKAELSHTEEELQSLRPNRDENSKAYAGTGETCFLKNGMNTVKVFIQVHYLKGYFLLHHLEDRVGRDQFLSFLRKYVQKYAHRLVTSQDFLNLFFETFPHLRTENFSISTIYSDWLDHAGMPELLVSSVRNGRVREEESGRRANQISEQLACLKDMAAKSRKRKRGNRGCKKKSWSHLGKLDWPVQVMLLFDRLLEEERLPGEVFDLLKENYGHHFDNAEVFHRWCELVIKHRRRRYFSDVKDFWIRHQAMGVYLYGEAMISENPDVTKMARDCFRQLQHDMPASVRETVSSMLFPS